MKLANGTLEATKVTVYEGNMPVRWKPSKILQPDKPDR